MLICFYDSKDIIYKEFVPTGRTINAVFYVGVLKRIRRIRPEYREEEGWRLLHDNAPSHRSTLTTDYLTTNRIETINHSPYSPDMAPCGFYLFGKLHLKGKRYADVDAIQKASTAILNVIPKDDLKKSFDNLLDRSNRCIQCERDYFEGGQ